MLSRGSKARNVVYIDNQEVELTERVIRIARVAKVVTGGRRFSFNALTVVGDGIQYVGVGFGKAREIPEAVRKSIEDAKKNLIRTKKKGGTVPFTVMKKFKSSRVLLKPAAPGTGIIAADSVKAILELGGYQDVLSKVIGSSNPINVTRATILALLEMETPDEVKKRRGIGIWDLFGPYSKKRYEEKRQGEKEYAK